MHDAPIEAALVRNLDDLAREAIGHAAPTHALVVYDTCSVLARLLAEGWRAALPHAICLDYHSITVPEAMVVIDALPVGSLVVLVQSTRFDLGEFRFRLELFQRGLHVVEHPHVGRIPLEEAAVYVDALAYDPVYFRGLGRALKARIDPARSIRVVTAHGILAYDGPFEDARLNVGDYTELPTVGGQFPIGEVFTEPVALEAVNGVVSIAAFGAEDFTVYFAETPFAVHIKGGRVVAAPDAPPAFHAILASIAQTEGTVWVRELGFGINRALTPTRRVNDVSAYERMCGVHLSLGAKHAVYTKAGLSKRRARFHVDMFCATDRVEIDGVVAYVNDGWVDALAGGSAFSGAVG